MSYFLKVKWIVIVVWDTLHDIWKFAFFLSTLVVGLKDLRALKQVCRSLCFMLIVLNSMTLAKTLTPSWYCIYETLVNSSNNNMLPTLFLTWYTFLFFVGFCGYLYVVAVPLICFWIQGTLIILIIVYIFFVFYFSGIRNEIIFLIDIMIVFLTR